MSTQYNECPKCGSTDIPADLMDFDSNIGWRIVHCEGCGFEWQEVFEFFRNESLNTCKLLDEFGNIIPS